MKIELHASTALNGVPASIAGTPFADRLAKDLDAGTATHADLLAEIGGRLCYESWQMPNEATATNQGYLANILKQGHYSVLEHASATFYVEGVSRSLTHELIRHRHLSFSELSQRYVDMSTAKFVTPPALRKGLGSDPTAFLGYAAPEALAGYQCVVDDLVAKGLKRKQAREAARAILPAGTETKILVTGNMRAWRDVLGKRYHVAADAEIREFATEVLRQLREIAPNSFQDFPSEPFGVSK